MNTCIPFTIMRLHRFFVCYVLLVLSLFFLSSTVKSEPFPPTLILKADKTHYSFAGKLAYFEDKQGSLSFAQVQQQAAQGSFKLINLDNISLGYIKSTIWLKFSIENHALPDQNWLLLFDYPLLNEIEVFSQTPQNTWKRLLMGDNLPFEQRPVIHRMFATEINTEQNQHQDFYVRVKTSSSMQLRLAVISKKSFFARELANEMFYGVLYGIMILMAFYNLFLYLAVRDKSYLVYVFSVISSTTFFMSLNGHAYQYLWPDYPQFANSIVPVSASLWIVFSAIFTQTFLETKHYAPRLYYAVNTLIILAICSVLLSLLGDYQLAIKTSTGLVLVNNILILITSIRCWLNVNRYARFFVAAWSVYGAGVALLVLSRYGLIPDSFVTHNSAVLGLVVEVIMLSLALSDKYRVLTTALESYAQELETKVKLRTQELEVSNQRLKDQSLADALTGLPNRRHFDQQLELEWNQLQREAKPLSILVCDIDEFKSINDHYGHQYGDQCLQTIAQRIIQAVHRPRDVPARIGGDEFIVILPDTDIEGAELLGRNICHTVERTAIPQAPDALYEVVTMSIGAATLIPDTNKDIKELFSLADRNLYQAKEKGRNRVVAVN